MAATKSHQDFPGTKIKKYLNHPKCITVYNDHTCLLSVPKAE